MLLLLLLCFCVPGLSSSSSDADASAASKSSSLAEDATKEALWKDGLIEGEDAFEEPEDAAAGLVDAEEEKEDEGVDAREVGFR